MLPILRFGVCRSSDWSIHVQRNFPRTNALLQPSLGAMTTLPMTGFHRTRGFPRMENNTLELQLLSEFCFLLCSLWFIGCRRREEIPSVSGILTRFPCSANKNACPIARVAHVPQKPCYSIFQCAHLIYCTQKDLSCLSISQAKEVSYSLYIRFDCTQKLPFYLNRKDWLVGWLVGWLQESFQLFTFL